MSYPRAISFMGMLFKAEFSAGAHVLERFVALSWDQIPFSTGALTSTIHSSTIEEPCGFSVDEGTGILLVDVPTDSGIVTRMSLILGEPGSWSTVG